MSRNSSPDTANYIQLLAWSCSCLCKPRQLVNNDGNDNSNNNDKHVFIENILSKIQLVSLMTNIKLLLSFLKQSLPKCLSWLFSGLLAVFPPECHCWPRQAPPSEAASPSHWVRCQVAPAPTRVYFQHTGAPGFKYAQGPFPVSTWLRPFLVARGSCPRLGAGAGISPDSLPEYSDAWRESHC